MTELHVHVYLWYKMIYMYVADFSLNIPRMNQN